MARERTQKVRESNREIATKNLKLEPKLEEARTVLVEKCVQLSVLRDEYDKKYTQLRECVVCYVWDSSQRCVGVHRCVYMCVCLSVCTCLYVCLCVCMSVCACLCVLVLNISSC